MEIETKIKFNSGKEIVLSKDELQELKDFYKEIQYICFTECNPIIPWYTTGTTLTDTTTISST